MKYSTAKKYILGFRKSVKKRGGRIDHSKLHKALRNFNAALDHNGLLGKY